MDYEDPTRGRELQRRPRGWIEDFNLVASSREGNVDVILGSGRLERDDASVREGRGRVALLLAERLDPEGVCPRIGSNRQEPGRAVGFRPAGQVTDEYSAGRLNGDLVVDPRAWADPVDRPAWVRPKAAECRSADDLGPLAAPGTNVTPPRLTSLRANRGCGA